MPRVRLVHWKFTEAGGLLERLNSIGYEIDFDEQAAPGLLRDLRTSPPDAIVLDLACLPSRSREFAIALRAYRETRHVPLVFVDGVAEKVDAVRRQLPDAVYTSGEGLCLALRQAIAHPPAEPVRPTQMMERYARRTTAQKLGIEENCRVAVIDPPRDYVRALGALPAGVTLDEESPEAAAVTLWFVHDLEGLRAELPAIRTRVDATRLWVLWRKGSTRRSGGVTQPALRDYAANLGLVDYKICAVNEFWSAMLFARKRSPRKRV